MKETFLVIFDVFNFGLLVFLWWLTVRHYGGLPQTIPVHFDFDGKADRFGSKKYFFLLPVILTVLYFIFTFVVRDSGSANFPVQITEENKHAQFLIMKIFIRWLFTLITLIFLNSQDYIFRYSFDQTVKQRVPLAISVLAVIGSLISVFILTGLFK